MTDEEAIQIFDDHQNGAPLSVGERLHSMSAISPILRFAKNMLLTPGPDGYHDRAVPIWKSRCANDKRHNYLTKLFALCSGLAFGPGAITKKWEDIQCQELLGKSFDVERTKAWLDALLSVFEKAQEIYPMNRKDLCKQFDPGYLSGYIVFSFHANPENLPWVVEQWVDFVVRLRNDATLLESVLHKDLGKARSWNLTCWEMGYLRVFDPAEAERRSTGGVHVPVSESDTEED